MTFIYYPRYVNMIILIVFNIFITILTKQDLMNIAFYCISLVAIIFLFGGKYILNENAITKYFYSLKTKVINIQDIKMVQIVTVKKIGTINIYIGKKANEIKEDGYYLIMNDGNKVKVYSEYQSKEGIPLGKYIISKYKLRYKSVEKYKLFNNYF